MAFDAWLAGMAGGTVGRLRVDAATARGSRVGPWREVEASLRSPRGRIIARLALELRPWSPTRTELGLRLLHTPRTSTARYFSLAHDAADLCASALQASRADAAA